MWAKTIKGEKILKSIIYELPEKFDEDKFPEYITEICYIMDIPTPVILSKNLRHYIEFNNTVWKSEDFVESVDLDKFVIEEASV